MQAMSFERVKLAKKVLASLIEHKRTRLDSIGKLVKAVQQLTLRGAFFKLRNTPAVIWRISQTFMRRETAIAWRHWLQSDRLMSLRRKIQINLLEDVFEAWKHRVAFKGGHSIHNRALKTKALATLIKRRKAGKVKRFRLKMAVTHYEKACVKTLLINLKLASQISFHKKAFKGKQQEAVALFRRDLLLRKGIKAWQKFSYRVRVQRYITGLQKLRYGVQFFANLRESFFEVRTEKMKETKAIAQHAQTLVVKSLVALRLHAQRSQIKSFKSAQATQKARIHLLSLCVASLRMHGQRQKLKRLSYQQALREH